MANVCARCDREPAETVSIEVCERALELDLCRLHLDALVAGSRPTDPAVGVQGRGSAAVISIRRS